MLRISLCFALALTFAPAPGTAHVVVYPDDATRSAPACATHTFTVRVPTEKAIATTAVRLEIPGTITFIAVQPKPGWRADLETTKGRVTAIKWSGGRLLPHEFEEFKFLAAAPKLPGSVFWDAEQTYEDGSIVRWTGDPGADTPHSQTDFTDPTQPCKGGTKK